MALVAKNEKPELAPEGTHLARCSWVIDLGWQHNEKFNKDQPKILVGWELVDTLIPDTDKPFMISREFTLNLSENSHLRPFIESWRGKAFTDAEINEGYNIKQVLGQWGYLSVVHSEDGRYANASSIIGLPNDVKKTISKKKTYNELTSFDLDNFDQETFDKLPRWVQEKIMKSEDWRKMNEEFEPSQEDIDDIDEEGFTGGPNKEDDVPFGPSKI